LIAALRQLVLIANDDVIAGILKQEWIGDRPWQSLDAWAGYRAAIASPHPPCVYKPADDGVAPWLNLSKAARLLNVAPRTLRLAAEAREIEAVHPLPDDP
jgi:hypothetical protein